MSCPSSHFRSATVVTYHCPITRRTHRPRRHARGRDTGWRGINTAHSPTRNSEEWRHSSTETGIIKTGEKLLRKRLVGSDSILNQRNKLYKPRFEIVNSNLNLSPAGRDETAEDRLGDVFRGNGRKIRT